MWHILSYRKNAAKWNIQDILRTFIAAFLIISKHWKRPDSAPSPEQLSKHGPLVTKERRTLGTYVKDLHNILSCKK